MSSPLEIRSFRSVFALERRIYRIDTLRLNPAGIPLRGIVYAAVLVAARAGRRRRAADQLARPADPVVPARPRPAAGGAGAAWRAAGRGPAVPSRGARAARHRLARRRLVRRWRRSPRARDRWRPPALLCIPDGSDARFRLAALPRSRRRARAASAPARRVVAAAPRRRHAAPAGRGARRAPTVLELAPGRCSRCGTQLSCWRRPLSLRLRQLPPGLVRPVGAVRARAARLRDAYARRASASASGGCSRRSSRSRPTSRSCASPVRGTPARARAARARLRRAASAARTRAYLAAQLAALDDERAELPAVYLAVSLEPPQRDVGAFVAELGERPPRELLEVCGRRTARERGAPALGRRARAAADARRRGSRAARRQPRGAPGAHGRGAVAGAPRVLPRRSASRRWTGSTSRRRWSSSTTARRCSRRSRPT